MPAFIEDFLPELDPVICCEETAYGWRGLTRQGEVYEVKGTNGHKAVIPTEPLTFYNNGVPYARRKITNELKVDIDYYVTHFNRVVEHYKANRLDEALVEARLTVMAAPTLRAKFNQSMILLASGNWRQGLSEYWECEQEKPFMRPQVERALATGLRPWKGEPLTGKRVLLLHAHGYGDTIQMLRYVPRLPKSLMVMPKELHSVAEQVGLVIDEPSRDCDFFCPILHLLYVLNVTPDKVHGGQYLRAYANRGTTEKWHKLLGSKKKRRIGLAWSIGKPSDGDYPRQIDLDLLVDHYRGKDVELHSAQVQGREEAEACGVYTHHFVDFLDCAAMMWHMDEVVSVDTAALHLAGAVGHPHVTGLLSHWHSWRWRAGWYNNVRLLRQTSPGDWASALKNL
jgi:hypothetical protein